MALALAGATQDLYAQTTKSNMEALFNTPPPGELPLRAVIDLKAGNKIIFEFTNLAQVAAVPNTDSLVKAIWTALAPFRDSLSKPLVSRRVDYYTTGWDERIRITEYHQNGSMYSITGNEILQLKTAQDTLRIKQLTPPPARRRKGDTTAIPYFIMLVLNNITDIESLPDGELQAATSLVWEDVRKSGYAKNTNPGLRMDAWYNLKEQKRVAPQKSEGLLTGNGIFLSLYSTFGLQYVYDSWIPSVAGGVEMRRMMNQRKWWSVALYIESYPLFIRNIATRKRSVESNTFICGRYTIGTSSKTDPSRLAISNSVAIGYLVQRNSELFDKVTFKITLPGLRFHNVALEPELINGATSLKLNLFIQ